MDDQMIGFIAGDTRRRDGLAWIAIIAVDPQYRRRGVGRALLLACESKLNVPFVRLTVRLSNSAAIALYEKEGYRTADIWKGYYYDGEDGLVMEKGL
jgi:ribosomal-protein-alanine N-acetyltransferase